jgi:FixJ family two-component response regulator
VTKPSYNIETAPIWAKLGVERGRPAPATQLGTERVAAPCCISVVDDDASVREATGGLLRSLGYAVRTFGSAEEFLDSGAEADTGCLITDLSMPGRSGFELQSDLTSRGVALPVIFVTAFATDADRARALEAGAAGFLSKPYSEARLAECLQRAFPPACD